ncbi:MAG: hypothetical protein HYY67_03250 [Thaumarchaeota archaeon]|nr:hypothetical protein [Nitrososphaerota archaeon]
MQVARLLERYLSWWRYEEELRFIALSPDALRLIFASLGSEKAAEIGKNIGKIFAQEMVLHIYGQINKGTVLQFLRVAMVRFPNYEYRVDGNKHSISVVHEINEQFSIYLSNITAEMLQSVGLRLDAVNKPISVHFSFKI